MTRTPPGAAYEVHGSSTLNVVIGLTSIRDGLTKTSAILRAEHSSENSQLKIYNKNLYEVFGRG